MKSATSNISNTLVSNTLLGYAMKSKEGEAGVTHHDSGPHMQSLLMERFLLGMRSRMPQKSNRNKTLVAEIVAPLLDRMEE